MKSTTTFLAAMALLAACSAVYAEYSVADRGEWPASWPKELEPLRKEARTLVGPMAENRHYLIPFTKREEFEAAWPHLLKAKSKGAPIFLVRGPKTDFFAIQPAGVVIHSPPAGSNNPELPIQGVTNVRERWMNATYFELAVDGKIVDLNRIPLPPDTPIVDERFKGADKQGGINEAPPVRAADNAQAEPRPAAPVSAKPDPGGSAKPQDGRESSSSCSASSS